jgi:hypothetical protein
LVSAWRAATWAFKRFVDTAASAVAEPQKAAPPPVELNALSLLDSLERDAAFFDAHGHSQSGWLQFEDAELIEEESEAPSTEEGASGDEGGEEASTVGTGKKKVTATEARGKAKGSRKTLRNEARRKGSRSKATKR